MEYIARSEIRRHRRAFHCVPCVTESVEEYIKLDVVQGFYQGDCVLFNGSTKPKQIGQILRTKKIKEKGFFQLQLNENWKDLVFVQISLPVKAKNIYNFIKIFNINIYNYFCKTPSTVAN